MAHSEETKIDPGSRAAAELLADARWPTLAGLSREGFRHDTVNALDEYRATGLHAMADDLHVWLSSWGSADELPAPECHP